MIDDETFLLLNAYRDGELSPGEALAMERRLASEPDLRAMADRLGALSSSVRTALASPPAPAGLRGRIVQNIGFRDAAPRREWGRFLMPYAAMLMIGLLGGGLVGGALTYVAVAPGENAPTDAIVSAHLRALMAPQPFDVASSNRHVVKPWFNGRTAIAPETVDLADHGFPLVGGRIDIVNGKPVPSLVYRHDQHVISVTVLPRSAGESTGEESRDGYAVERWTAGDLAYWAVSDVARSDLRAFADLYRTQAAAQTH